MNFYVFNANKYLEMNGVGGTLPFELRDLGDLRFLILERGTISGTIPSQFGEIEDLLFLDLDFNNLSGDCRSAKWPSTAAFWYSRAARTLFARHCQWPKLLLYWHE